MIVDALCLRGSHMPFDKEEKKKRAGGEPEVGVRTKKEHQD